MTRLMSWPDVERYSYLLQSLVFSLLFCLVSTLFFSLTEVVLSHQNSLTHIFPRFPLRNCAPSSARCVHSRLRCTGHSLLLSSYFSRIGRIENFFCSARGHPSQYTSHLILHCPATDSFRSSLFGESPSLYDLWSRPGELPGFWGSMVFRHAPNPWKGSGNNNNCRLKNWLKSRKSLCGGRA